MTTKIKISKLMLTDKGASKMNIKKVIAATKKLQKFMPSTVPTQVPVGTGAYAAEMIKKMNPDSEHIVTLEDRLKTLMAADPSLEFSIKGACAIFKSKNPNIKTWKDLRLPEAYMMSLHELMIDIIRQREMNTNHMVNIVENFKRLVIAPLFVYRTKKDGAINMSSANVWDGQHTVLALYIIATEILGINDLREVMVPVAIYDPDSMVELRRAFIEQSSGARMPFVAADHHRQHVLARRVDDCDDYLMDDLKQQALESVGMFVTNEQYKDHKQPGALSNLTDFDDKRYSINVHNGFCRWVLATCGDVKAVTRPSSGKESHQVYEFLHLCEECGIDFTENDFQYVRDCVAALNAAYKGKFTPDALHDKAKASFDHFYSITMKMGTDHGVKYQKRVGDIHFMIAQLKKYMPKTPLPAFKPEVRGQWKVSQGTL